MTTDFAVLSATQQVSFYTADGTAEGSPSPAGACPQPGAHFGAVARWMGFLTTRETLDAFAVQVHEEGIGLPRRPIGVICQELGYMSDAEVQEVLRFQNSQRAR